MRETTLSPGFGLIIEADERTPLAEMDGRVILQRLSTTGAIVLRGFTGDTSTFENFTRTVASRFIHNGNDSRLSLGDEGRTRSVTPGQNFLGPHSEFAYTPGRPDVLFFYCLRPAVSGGASLLWYGRELWVDMPADLKNLFLDKRLRYSFTNVDLGFFTQVTGATEMEAICRFLDEQPGVTYQRRGQEIDIEFCTFAQRLERFGNALAFANSIVIDGRTVFEDGSPLPPLKRSELLAYMLAKTVKVAAQQGDVIVIDNTRVMHGRTAFTDTQRLICSRMGFLELPS
jgi:alpha-ketoglutarate-dependent taurine dioxygenase